MKVNRMVQRDPPPVLSEATTSAMLLCAIGVNIFVARELAEDACSRCSFC